jgi:hypothetical protein
MFGLLLLDSTLVGRESGIAGLLLSSSGEDETTHVDDGQCNSQRKQENEERNGFR